MNASASSGTPLFSVRLVSIDSYTAPPLDSHDDGFSDFGSRAIHRVPVIRVYGATPAGQKVTAHIHGVYPYAFIPLPHDLANADSLVPVHAFIQRLAVAIEDALNGAASGGGGGGKGPARSASVDQHVRAITLVRGKPFYGYARADAVFLKIELLSPYSLGAMVKLMREGLILGRVMQPYEAHVPYHLQFCIDYNLYGMGFLNADAVAFRSPILYKADADWRLGPTPIDDDTAVAHPTPGSFAIPLDTSPPTHARLSQLKIAYRVWTAEALVPDQRMPTSVQRLSTTELEVDIRAADIVNARTIPSGDLAVDSGVKLVPSLAAIWEDEALRRALSGQEPAPTPPDPPPRSPIVHEWVEPILGDLASLVAGHSPPVADELPPLLAASPTTNSQASSTHASQLSFDLESALGISGSPSEPHVAGMQLALDDDADDGENAPHSQPAFGALDELLAWAHASESSSASESDADNNLTAEAYAAAMMTLASSIQLDGGSRVGEGSRGTCRHRKSRRRPVQPPLETPMTVVASQLPAPPAALARPCVHHSDALPGTRFFDSLALWDPAPASATAPRLSNAAYCFRDPLPRPSSPTAASAHRHRRTTHWVPAARPPAMTSLPRLAYVHPRIHFSDPADMGRRITVSAGRTFRHMTTPYPVPDSAPVPVLRPCVVAHTAAVQTHVPIQLPPSPGALSARAEGGGRVSRGIKPLLHTGTTTKRSQTPSQIMTLNDNQHLTTLSLEVVFTTRKELLPDPRLDPLVAVAYTVGDDDLALARGAPSYIRGVMAVTKAGDGGDPRRYGLDRSVRYRSVANEQLLIEAVVELVRQMDPDILTGYEVQQSSWGLLIERAGVLGYNLCKLLGRCGGAGANYYDAAANRDAYGLSHNSGIHVSGRIVLNAWRLLRKELTLRMYSYAAVVESVLHTRVPVYPPARVTRWWLAGSRRRVAVLDLVLARSGHVLAIFDKLNFVGRTSEQARVFGIDFFSVLSRGSQYRVESMLMRLTKPRNYVLVSPSPEQVSAMAAAQAVPLIMEPVSRVYTDPVVVLDFASLYPSVIIAHNYCYSTTLGRVSGAETKELGVVTAYHLAMGETARLARSEALVAAPNSVLFTKPELRPGVLPKMLSELLETRVMVKKALSKARAAGHEALARMLDARQESLKLIANVTYGYTTASFSGRMPMIELADAIVQTGRETLEDAIRYIEANADWGARVVYGDTDSVFVRLAGASKMDAFRIAREIAAQVTARYKAPIRLKFEKVYLPCALLTKKRYVGYAWEDEGQTEPIFDAKGIETVRRDTAPVTSRILEKVLRVLFETSDVSAIKAVLNSEWRAIHADALDMREYMFAKEVKLGSYAAGRVPPPVALVAQRRMRRDPRAEPRYKERVPYLVVYGPPDAKLYEQVVDPREVLRDLSLVINAKYYCVNNVNAALDRVLSQIGVDVAMWYARLGKIRRAAGDRPRATRDEPGATIATFFASRLCPACREADVIGTADYCTTCAASPVLARYRVAMRAHAQERERARLRAICLKCVGEAAGVEGVDACEAVVFGTGSGARRSGSRDGGSASGGGQGGELEGRQPYDYYLVFDVEATCEAERNSKYPHEIIEFPVVVMTGEGEILESPRFHTYLKPTTNPILSEFCTELTGITQDQVDAGMGFEEMLHALDAWLDDNEFFTAAKPTVFACDGPWDVRDFVAGECKRKRVEFPWYMRSWVDIRHTYHRHYRNGARRLNGMLEAIGMEFEGREHSGMDDAINIARLASAIIRDGGSLAVNRVVDRRRALDDDQVSRVLFYSYDFATISDFAADELIAAHPAHAPRLQAFRVARAAAAKATHLAKTRKQQARRNAKRKRGKHKKHGRRR
ncbi:uncharacterized protein AMSG_12260 [Thecamonas trahens ATCC 50062]|uniref:DNA polymerase n=1 Tax=Thecamonas trahens ATCC 50062 TaxID=461836 RepID=A0A0L0DM50_THETB|nr:hypothetical protein AMSG_12260 [Thecamonas trahens ATCC 50062]KNC53096.1 hypothetical protein AMSG_12260 [Thecamonas trahens ATCC 50062]|eukprot:XP_013754808.1 hypothetical protein AMSG_12260 [Thecamonas trahens ATCC 50062]